MIGVGVLEVFCGKFCRIIGVVRVGAEFPEERVEFWDWEKEHCGGPGGRSSIVPQSESLDSVALLFFVNFDPIPTINIQVE